MPVVFTTPSNHCTPDFTLKAEVIMVLHGQWRVPGVLFVVQLVLHLQVTATYVVTATAFFHKVDLK